MILTHIITADTRDGWLEPKSEIGAYGSTNLSGCRSVDFLTDGVVAKNRYLESPLITERRTVLCVDIHNSIPNEVMDEIIGLTAAGEITKFVARMHSKSEHRWNDRIYLRALAHADGADLVAKWDGDTVGYRRPDFDVLAMYLGHLDAGASYVCQQTPLSKEEHCMDHASTRFFLTRRSTLDLSAAERMLDDRERAKQFHGRHLPCLEHLLGAMSGDTVLYPPSQNEDFLAWSWVHYFRGTMAKLNAMSYGDVYQYVFETCGGVHGASDMVGKEIA